MPMKLQKRIIQQADLTSECWSVQVWGFDACEKCELKGTDDCGGKEMCETGQNEKGLNIPIPSENK